MVGGSGEARVTNAIDALTPLLAAQPLRASGLLTRLAGREAAQATWTWVCETCDSPDCEHALRALKRR